MDPAELDAEFWVTMSDGTRIKVDEDFERNVAAFEAADALFIGCLIRGVEPPGSV